MLQNSSICCQENFLTPSSNTGSDSQSASLVPSVIDCQPKENSGRQNLEVVNLQPQFQYEPWVDYYQATARMQYSTLRELVKYYQEIFGEELTPMWGHGRYIGNRTYTYKLQSPLGTQLYWTEDMCNELLGIGEYLQLSEDISIDENGELSADAIISASTWIYAHLSIPGKPLNQVGVEKHLEFIYEATAEYGFNVTRIDTKVRDYSGSFAISDLVAIARRGDFSGSKSYSTYASRRLREGTFSTDDTFNFEFTECSGETIYFGSPASDKRTTFYDAKYVHDVDAIDIEVRWRNERAKSCLSSILFQESGERMPIKNSIRAIHSIVAGSINFIHRGSDKNINRLSMYDFWREFVGASDGVLKISLPKRLLSGYRMVEWVSKQVAPTLAMCRKILGTLAFRDFIERILQQGEERLSESQRAYLRLCMQTREQLKKHMSANNMISS